MPNLDVPTATPAGVCAPWVTLDEACDCSVEDEDLLQSALDTATDVLYELSGRQFSGECELSIRPCARCGPRPCRGCGSSLSQVKLPGDYPTEVLEVLVDGEVVDPDEYRLDGRWLVALGQRRWPTTQRLELATTERYTFEVTYLQGQDPPALGRQAALELACELALACSTGEGVGGCRLPARVTTVVRQGVTTVALNPNELFANGVGLPVSDLFIATYNPRKLQRRGRFWHPSTRSVARRSTG